MRDSTPSKRPSWSDRFQRPTARSLRADLPVAARRLYDAFRRHLLSLDGVEERFAWYGDGWQWCIEYRTRHSDEPLALLIPCPSDLQLALPLDREFTNSLPIKRMKRAVRDGLELTQEPFDTRWGVWSVTAASLVDDLQDLIELKLVHLAKRAG